MAIYEYRCPLCGVFEVARAMGSAAASHECAHCASEARRVYSVPRVNRAATPLTAALARAERSQDEPEVVTSVPARHE